jgi:hypothetical protein
MTHRAEALNARGVRTARGGRWYGQTVKNVLRRAGEVPRHPRSGADGGGASCAWPSRGGAGGRRGAQP